MKPHRVFSGPQDAIAEVRQGRVQGFLSDGIFTFLGIPYGDDTGGANRFRLPKPAPAWEGTRPCLYFGPICPQSPRAGAVEATRAYQEEGFLLQWREGVQSENCLNLNVWTPGLGADAARPVMVWLHGGHFAYGASSEIPATHGEDLSRKGDVVVVSVNHRLNIFGFMPAVSGDPAYRHTGTLGMLDIVLALEWVRENIAAFGGDPECVTIFGQSGGGAKVTTLLAMPAAHGLFHRAIVQSNCALRQCGAAQAERIAHVVRDQASGSDPMANLLARSPGELVSLEARLMQQLALPENPARRNNRLRWEPVVDGDVLPEHAFDPEAPAISRDIPLLVGTTLNEFHHGIGTPDPEAMTFAEVAREFDRHFGPQAGTVLEHFRTKYPALSAFEIRSRAYSATIRESAVIQARRKAGQEGAPAYLYWFCWKTPALGGRPGAFHNAELPFVFNSVQRCREWTTGSAEAVDLAGIVSRAWIQFARSGNPNHPGLPEWSPVTVDGSETMIFDAVSRFEPDPDGDERVLTGAA